MITRFSRQATQAILWCTLVLGLLGSTSSSVIAQRILVQPQMFPEQGGEAIYKGVCQACHMPDAKGGVGAGMYPALAKNPKLAVAGYPISVVVNGQKAMPAFLGTKLSDQQIADVVNYVRTHFGNSYADMVTAADVKAVRP